METLVTIDEELNILDSQLRRLKIEYEIFFNNPTKRPPTDIEWKVLSLLRKFCDGGRMNFSQRYRYNEMAQRYAMHSDLWRKKLRIREEGYRRPQDALLSVQGVRVAEDEHKAHTTPCTASAMQLRRRQALRQLRPNISPCTAPTKPSANRSNGSITLWWQPRKKREKTSLATSIHSLPSCRKRPNRSRSSITARM